MTQENAIQVSKASENEIVLTRTFAASREHVFTAITDAKHLSQWMKPTHMQLVTCETDVRAGGTFLYVFQRPGGKKIEVRGLYSAVDPPHSVAYTETYDFSPLKILVTTVLDAVDTRTIFKQTLTYPSKSERDEDFEGVVESANEVYTTLDLYLAQLR